MIQVGAVLDKYELLDRVGQGGMAVVYRGIDRTLKRVVAVKILHRHLAEHQEARDRFEREAQAVAKLRHENILEIFDYSAKEGQESYIVTEFIDGQTLKQCVTERPIAFPEIGAMVMLQVCRALAHAHAGAILHRDVKPENIMIRADGVVKLMDFGISHMVDLERLTVTGQLLGSPAYMAPEHVEGRPLDFRTDVFAAGIVLYQLSVGKLPFEGKNPHEVLKRIADCHFVDPRQANPRIGNRLGRIILRAMARSPDARFPSIGEMVIALEGYLDESGLPGDKVASELARYFQAPAPYEAALKTRLVETLTRAGQRQLDDDNRAGALDAFDRVLTLDPENAKVVAILDRLGRRARATKIAAAVAAVGVIAAGAYAIHLRTAPQPTTAPNVDIALAPIAAPEPRIAHETRPQPAHASGSGISAPAHVVEAAVTPPAPITPPVAHVVAPVVHDAGVPLPDAATAPVAIALATIHVLPGSTYSTDGVTWLKIDGTALALHVDHAMDVQIRNRFTADTKVHVAPGAGELSAEQQFLPATVTLHCAIGDFDSVSTDGTAATDGTARQLEQPFTVPFVKNATSSRQKISVQFYRHNGQSDVQTIEVAAGQTKDVTCALH